jgi:hypothetical protein
MVRRLCLTLLLSSIAAIGLIGSARAASLVNGGFETGTLEGWQTAQTPGGEWSVYTPIEPGEDDGIYAPFEGASEALFEEAHPSSTVLYQEVPLEAGQSHELSLGFGYESFAAIAVPSPDTLGVLGTDVEGAEGQPNQQVRVDVMKAGSPLYSLAPEDILATLFATRVGDPEEIGWTHLTANLAPFAGQTVRLRIAAVANSSGVDVAVDAAPITSAPLPAVSAPAPSTAPPAPVAPAPTCTVPKLGGKTLKASKKKIKAADCRVGKVTRRKGAKAESGKVVGQSKKPGTVLPAGNVVKVTLGKG